MATPTVVVIGAGLSGLAAASELYRRRVDVVVLEAADRVGGRAMSVTSSLGSRLDLGGQWIGHDHHRVMALAADLGLTRFPMHTAALPSVIDGGRRLSPGAPAALVAGLALVGTAMVCRLGTPARSKDSTVAGWLQKVPGRTARRLLEMVALISWTADLDRISVPSMVAMIRHHGGLRKILGTRGGAQDSLLVEGAGTLAERLAAELGSRVRTETPVTSIVREHGGITVGSAGGALRAVKVIMAMPPPMAARIAHKPALPAERLILEQNSFMGSVYKAIAVYDRPFWRRRANAELIVLDRPGVAVFDTTAPGGPGHLCLLVGGPDARDLDALDAHARRQLLLGASHPISGWRSCTRQVGTKKHGIAMNTPEEGIPRCLIRKPATGFPCRTRRSATSTGQGRRRRWNIRGIWTEPSRPDGGRLWK